MIELLNYESTKAAEEAVKEAKAEKPVVTSSGQ
jgi:hypothetical protein